MNQNIAHITAEDGTVFQVLNATGDDWDEASTRAEYESYIQENPIVVPTE